MKHLTASYKPVKLCFFKINKAVTTGDIGKLVTCLFKCSLNHFSFGVKGQLQNINTQKSESEHSRMREYYKGTI